MCHKNTFSCHTFLFLYPVLFYLAFGNLGDTWVFPLHSRGTRCVKSSGSGGDGVVWMRAEEEGVIGKSKAAFL